MRGPTTSAAKSHVTQEPEPEFRSSCTVADPDQHKMGSTISGRQGPGLVVAFDFDGTLTFRDSYMAFLAWRAGPWRYAAGLVRLIPASLHYLFDRDRGRLKAAAAKVFVGGLTPAELEAEAGRYAESDEGRRLIRPDAARCWASWRDRGAELAIVTASPEAVVAPFARRLGADRLIGTRLSLDGNGRIDGGLEGANCRGQEKVARLKAIYGEDLELAAAYGDTSGDLEMLQLANERGYRVFHERAP